MLNVNAGVAATSAAHVRARLSPIFLCVSARTRLFWRPCACMHLHLQLYVQGCDRLPLMPLDRPSLAQTLVPCVLLLLLLFTLPVFSNKTRSIIACAGRLISACTHAGVHVPLEGLMGCRAGARLPGAHSQRLCWWRLCRHLPVGGAPHGALPAGQRGKWEGREVKPCHTLGLAVTAPAVGWGVGFSRQVLAMCPEWTVTQTCTCTLAVAASA